MKIAFEIHHLGVVDEAVDHGGGHGGVAEDLAPAAEGLFASDDERGSLVARGDQLQEEVGRLGLERQVAHLVDDEQGGAVEALELVGQAPGRVRVRQTHHPLHRSGEEDTVAGLASADAERNGEMGLAGPRRAEKHDVLLSGHEVERTEMGNDGALHGVLVVEIKVLERLVAGEARGSNAMVTAVSLACRHLPFQTRGEELVVGPRLAPGALSQAFACVVEGRRLQGATEVSEIAHGGHAVATAKIRS